MNWLVTYLQAQLYEEYVKNGYRDNWNKTRPAKHGDLAELGLVVTEISEVMEHIRNKETDFNEVGLECADIIIRVTNFMTRKGLDLQTFILLAHAKNIERGYLHGKEV